jgi:hypothetical protein
VSATTAPLWLTTDELRAAARLAGVPVPPLAADGDPDDPRVDLAALRGLALRSLVVGLDQGRPEPAGDLATALEALDEPDRVVDVDVEVAARPDGEGEGEAPPGHEADRDVPGPVPTAPGSRLRRRTNHTGGPRGRVTLSSHGSGFVGIRLVSRRPDPPRLRRPDPSPDLAEGTPGDPFDADALADDLIGVAGASGLAAALRPAGARPGQLAPGPAPDGFTVSRDVHVEADALVLAGDPEGATSALADAGVPQPLARRWVGAVAGRASAAAVRVVRRLPGDGVEVRELRWLVDEHGVVWRVDAAAGPDAHDGGPPARDLAAGGWNDPRAPSAPAGPGDLDGGDEQASAVRIVSPVALRAELVALLRPAGPPGGQPAGVSDTGEVRDRDGDHTAGIGRGAGAGGASADVGERRWG